MKRRLRRSYTSLTILLLTALLAMAACKQESLRERSYTMYVDLEPEPTPEPTPEVREEVEPEVSIEEKNSRRKAELNKRYDIIKKRMIDRDLLTEDVDGAFETFNAVPALLRAQQWNQAKSRLDKLEKAIAAVTVDEVFITQKNARLLGRIQEVSPPAETLAQIDNESQKINELLEKADYAAINRRLNKLFDLLNP